MILGLDCKVKDNEFFLPCIGWFVCNSRCDWELWFLVSGNVWIF
jgi:hypothetical protein